MVTSLRPEDAFYFECLLAIGFSDEYDEWLNSALESESPLSDITLEFISCGTDVNKTISTLYEYHKNKSIDEKTVCDRLRKFLKEAYYSKQMDKDKVVLSMYLLASHINNNLENNNSTLWESMYYFGDYYDLADEGILDLKDVDSAFFDYLNDGVPLDSNRLWKTCKRPTFFEHIKNWLKKIL